MYRLLCKKTIYIKQIKFISTNYNEYFNILKENQFN